MHLLTSLIVAFTPLSGFCFYRRSAVLIEISLLFYSFAPFLSHAVSPDQLAQHVFLPFTWNKIKFNFSIYIYSNLVYTFSPSFPSFHFLPFLSFSFPCLFPSVHLSSYSPHPVIMSETPFVYYLSVSILLTPVIPSFPLLDCSFTFLESLVLLCLTIFIRSTYYR